MLPVVRDVAADQLTASNRCVIHRIRTLTINKVQQLLSITSLLFSECLPLLNVNPVRGTSNRINNIVWNYSNFCIRWRANVKVNLISNNL